jgi:hypothetical protein
MSKDVGISSIRIAGKSADELPLVAGTHFKMGLPAAIKSDTDNKIGQLRAIYPKLSVQYIDSRVKECYENIDRVSKLRVDQNEMINEYTGHITLCKYRDTQIAGLDPVADASTIKQLKRDFPPYNVEAMETQIGQCKEAIKNASTVIQQEHDSIAEFQGAKTLCVKRDKELAELGEYNR